MVRELPNTPGPLGYALMLLTSACVMPPLYPVPAYLSSDGAAGNGVGDFLGVWLMAVPITLLVAAPFAAVGIPLVHALCRQVPSQRAHVSVAGLVVLVEVFGLWVMLDRTGPTVVEELAFAGSAAVGAAVGRAVVIPIVLARRARAARPAA